MSTVLHIEEESAIIPLKRLNEMKENEKVFREHKGFVRLEYTNYWDSRTYCYFISDEHEASRAIYNKVQEMEEVARKADSYDRSKEKEHIIKVRDLESRIRSLEGKLRSLKKKKWYQFVEFKPEDK